MKTKTIISLIGATLFSLSLRAQNQTYYDAIKASGTELHGTARFVGVGGAMGALGGDASTLVYNPAGIGIYRSSELTLTGNVNWTNSTANNQRTYEAISANLDNVAYIGAFKTGAEKGLTYFNFGIGYNRIKSFRNDVNYTTEGQNYSMSQFLGAYSAGIEQGSMDQIGAYLNEDLGWRSIAAYRTGMIENATQTTYRGIYDKIGGTTNNYIKLSESGSINEFALSLGANISDIFYFGMSFICDYLYYSQYTFNEETLADGSLLTSSSNYSMSGTGFTYKVGVIVKPVNWLRIGGAFHTPTWYVIKDAATSNYSTRLMGQNYQSEQPEQTVGTLRLSSPLKALGSLGFLMGKWGFIGIDYEYANFQGMILKDNYRSVMGDVNELVQTELNDTHTIRMGIEVKPLEALSLRVGGGYTTAINQASNARNYYINDTRMDLDYYNTNHSYNVTAGMGYRFGRHALDLAYIWQVNNYTHYQYAPFYSNDFGGQFEAPSYVAGDIRQVRNQMLLTYSVRF